MRFTTLLTIATAVPTVLAAQTQDTLSLLGRSTLILGVGLTGTREATSGPGGASARTTGQLASLAFTHFVRPNAALEVSGAVLDANSTSNSPSADAVTALLFGMSYSPGALAITRSIRPFVSAAVGPYSRWVSQTSGYTSSASSQTQLGGRVGAGVSSYVTRHFVVQAETYYHAVGKFTAINNVAKDPSGFGFSVGLGFAWGNP
jgi:hypothetical protein